MIQLHLGPFGAPVDAAYSQHSGGERCDWIHVPRELDGRPIVYVAEGSHANYFSSGYHLNGGANDTSGGDGEWVIPAVTDVTTTPPRWLAWPGRWGGSDSSPDGPAQKGTHWSDPLAWQNGIDGCTEGQTFPYRAKGTASSGESRTATLRAPSGRPPLPRVVASRSGNRLVVRYAFRAPLPTAKSRRPWLLLTAVKSAGTTYPPLTKRTLVRTARGRIVQPLGLGPAPFTLRVTVLARNGRRAGSLTVPLR
jgi:hypothetical protein